MADKQYHAALTELAMYAGDEPERLLAKQELIIDGVGINFSFVQDELGGAIQRACLVTAVIPEKPIKLLRVLLQAGTLGSSTGGATFGLKSQDTHLIFARRMPLDTLPDVCAKAWRNLAESATRWASAIEQSGWS